MTEIHPAVELLLARMKSHPEEFPRGGGRWAGFLDNMQELLSEEETSLLKSHMRTIRLDEVHEDIMDELLNGPERRAEAERQAAIQQQARIQLEAGLAQKLDNAFPAQLQQGALRGRQAPWEQYQNALSTSVYADSISTAPTIRIGDETLDEGLLKSIKKALKL
jgi:hypothetical protein